MAAGKADWDTLLLQSEDLVLRVRSRPSPACLLCSQLAVCCLPACQRSRSLLLGSSAPRPVCWPQGTGCAGRRPAVAAAGCCAPPIMRLRPHKASGPPTLQENQGFPRVERDVLQVEQFSAKLRAKATRVDATSEALDASRLLAQEGLNPRKWVMRCALLALCCCYAFEHSSSVPGRKRSAGSSQQHPALGPPCLAHSSARRLNQALQTLQLRPTYEDVFQVESSTVEEYQQQVRGGNMRGGRGARAFQTCNQNAQGRAQGWRSSSSRCERAGRWVGSTGVKQVESCNSGRCGRGHELVWRRK